MEKWRHKGIKRPDHMSPGGLSRRLSGPVLHLTSTVCPIFSLNSVLLRGGLPVLDACVSMRLCWRLQLPATSAGLQVCM